MSLQAPIPESVRSTVERVLWDRMAIYALRRVEIRSGEDHDGDPVLYIDAYYDYSTTPIDAETTSGLVTELRDRLEALGETRFPHLRHHFDERQQVARAS